VTGNPQDTFRRAGTSTTVGRRLEMTVLVRGVDDRCEQTHTPHLDPCGFVSSRRDRMHGPFPGATRSPTSSARSGKFTAVWTETTHNLNARCTYPASG